MPRLDGLWACAALRREWEVMRGPPAARVQMVAGIKSLGSAVEVIRCHHERWDGKGYPSGLAGEAIPAGARVFSVADAFDAMTSDRPYRKAIPFDQACQEIADGAGSQFDPAVVDAFTAIVPDLPGLHAALHGGPVDSLARSIPYSATLPLRGAEPGAGPLEAALQAARP
jgi:HD-GYP domain-containing protein (c-di-GMP phosphodiesterase class II)